MSENNQNDEMFDLSYIIHIEKKQFPKKIIELLKRNNVKFGVWKLYNQKAEYEDETPEKNNTEETITISIPKDLYLDLDKLCKINNVDTNKKIISILGKAVFSAEIDNENGFKHVGNF